VQEERRKAQRLTQNMRASSYGMSGNPLVSGGLSVNSKDDEDQPLALKIQAYKDKMAGLGPQEQPRAQSMMFNPMMNMSQPNMMMGMNGMGMQNPMMMGQMQPQMQMGMQPNMLGMNNMAMMSQMSLQQPAGMQPGAVHPGMGNRQSSMPMQMSMMQGGPQMNVMGGMPMMQGGMGMQGMMDPSMMLPPMNTQQRSNIEGWMRGIR
jgi:hypothetical protein